MQKPEASSKQEYLRRVRERAMLIMGHIEDVKYVTSHRDELRAVTLMQALTDETNMVGIIQDALRHGENALLVRLLAHKEVIPPPGPYAAAISMYALMELTPQEKEFPEEDLFVMYNLLIKHYAPVPHAPYTREQVIQAMQDE